MGQEELTSLKAGIQDLEFGQEDLVIIGWSTGGKRAYQPKIFFASKGIRVFLKFSWQGQRGREKVIKVVWGLSPGEKLKRGF